MSLFGDHPPFLATYGPTLVPVILGAAAVYLLLPRPRNRAAAAGGLLGAVALLAAGVLLTGAAGRVTVESILFYAFAGLAVLAGGLMISVRSPARAAVCFALVILSTCGLFLLQAALFLMAATIIIYAGAIIVTFLFVIMLSQQEGASDADERSREPFLATVAGFGLLAVLLLTLQRTYDTRGLDRLIERADAASRQETAAGFAQALGDRKEFLADLRRETERLRGTPGYENFAEMALAAEQLLSQPSPEGLLVQRGNLGALAGAGRMARPAVGLLRPPSTVKLSAYSGLPSEPSVNCVPPAMPAENVEALGRSLFSDYLLAVELGGTLLLVATVGAIAITGRREEATP